MKTTRQIGMFCIICWFVLAGEYTLTYGQLTATPTIPTPVKRVESEHDKTIATLRGIIQSMEALEEQLGSYDFEHGRIRPRQGQRFAAQGVVVDHNVRHLGLGRCALRQAVDRVGERNARRLVHVRHVDR